MIDQLISKVELTDKFLLEKYNIINKSLFLDWKEIVCLFSILSLWCLTSLCYHKYIK